MRLRIFLVFIFYFGTACSDKAPLDSVTAKGAKNAIESDYATSLGTEETATSSEFVYRLEAHLDEAEILESTPSHTSDKPDFYFDTAVVGRESKEGASKVRHHLWTPTESDAIAAYEDGSMVLSTTTPGFFVSPSDLRIDAKKIKAVDIRMKVTGAESIEFGWRLRQEDEFDWTSRFSIPITETGDWKIYRIRFSGVFSWRNETVVQLRFSLPENSRVEIAHLDFLSPSDMFAQESVGKTFLNVIGDEMRTALYAFCPSRIAYTLSLPRGSRFKAGLKILGESNPVSFSATLINGDRKATLFTQQIDTISGWNEINVAIPAEFEGVSRLVIESRSATPGQVALWSNPLVYVPRKRAQHATNPEIKPNIILYVVDTLRADRLPTYGNTRIDTPHFDALAREGTLFERSYSNATWTKPSVLSMFTGLLPSAHGAYDHHLNISDSAQLLSEILRDHGYETATVSENPYTPPNGNADRGFSNARILYEAVGDTDEFATLTLPGVISFIESNLDSPFFLHVQTMEPHKPRPARDNYLAQMRGVEMPPSEIDKYDSEIIRADENFGKLVKYLKSKGLYDSTLIIFTSDHGELLAEGDRAVGHAGAPVRRLINVPLIMRHPSFVPQGVRIAAHVQSLDLPSTIFDVSGVTQSEQFMGTSLLPLMKREKVQWFEDRWIFSEFKHWHNVAIIGNKWKLLNFLTRAQLFNIHDDPMEYTDLAADYPRLVGNLREDIDSFGTYVFAVGASFQSGYSQDQIELNPAEMKRLKALGYLN